MKQNLEILMLSICAFSVLTLFGCGEKTVDDVIVTPKPPVSVAAKSYYVSDALGSDSNPGVSASAPLKTITAGQNLAAPGDTVFIMNGSYLPATTILLFEIVKSTIFRAAD